MHFAWLVEFVSHILKCVLVNKITFSLFTSKITKDEI